MDGNGPDDEEFRQLVEGDEPRGDEHRLEVPPAAGPGTGTVREPAGEAARDEEEAGVLAQQPRPVAVLVPDHVHPEAGEEGLPRGLGPIPANAVERRVFKPRGQRVTNIFPAGVNVQRGHGRITRGDVQAMACPEPGAGLGPAAQHSLIAAGKNVQQVPCLHGVQLNRGRRGQ